MKKPFTSSNTRRATALPTIAGLLFTLPALAQEPPAATQDLPPAQPAAPPAQPGEADPPAQAADPGPVTAAPIVPETTAAPAEAAPVVAAPEPTAQQAEGYPQPDPMRSAEPGPVSQESWFSRAPLKMSVGSGDDELSLTLYGFLQADFIYDTTRSYSDSIGASVVQRTDTYDGTVSRAQASGRNSRIAMAFKSPKVGSLAPTAIFEGDFMGNQPSSPPDTSETDYYDSATFRLRHAYLRLDNDMVDVLVGQTYDVFGWQNYFFPTSAEFLGLPHQVFSRHPQIRLSQEYGETGTVGVDFAVAATRPVQRDSGIPDGHAGVRLKVNGFKGLRTSGNGGTDALPLALGVSSVVRTFKVDAFTPPPTQTSEEVSGWGLSIDALVPVLAADSADDRGNKLTLTGSFVTGTGIGDLITTNGGASFPTLPNPAQANPPPEYHGNVDHGLVSYDTQGELHTIDWQALRVGLVYYLPPTGRLFISANYTQAYSKNMRDLFPQGGAEIELLTRVVDRSRYADINLFFDATNAVRFGLAGSYTAVEYIDGDKPHNYRGHAQAMYFF